MDQNENDENDENEGLNKSLLLVSLDEETMELCQRFEKYGYQLHCVSSGEEFKSFLEKKQPPALCIFGYTKEGFKGSDEAVEQLTSVAPDVKIIYLNYPVSKKEEVHDGVIFRFHCRVQREEFLNTVFQQVDIKIPIEKLDFDALSRVTLSEIEGEETFPFDIFLFLPLNRKILLYRAAGRAIDKELSQKVATHEKLKLFIRRSEYHAYQEMQVEHLKMIASDPELSSEERSQALKEETGKLVGDFFAREDYTDQEGQELLENFKNIAIQFVGEVSGKEEVVQHLHALTSQVMSHSSHATNVSTYSVMFGLLMGEEGENIETLSLAGLLHDIGYYKLPMNLTSIAESELEDEERLAFRSHVGLTFEVIDEKKIDISPLVRKIIEQHHELPDGTGYPKGLKSEEIDLLTKICAFADVFDELTSYESRRSPLTPAEALRAIAGLGGKPPHAIYEAKIFEPLITELLGEEGNEKTETKKSLEGAQESSLMAKTE